LTPLSTLLILASALLHSSWHLFAKRGQRPIEFFFWIFFWGTIFYIPFFVALGAFPSLLIQASPNLWALVICSGLLETIYFVCLIEAYQGGDLSLVYPVSRSAPLFTQIWAVLFIGEILSARGVAGIILVMAGIFVMSLGEFRTQRTISSIRPYLLALSAAVASSIYSVIDKVGVQILHPIFYLWFVNVWMTVDTGIYLLLRKRYGFLKFWRQSKKEMFLIAILLNAAYLLVLLAMQMSKVSYVVAFRQVGALFGAVMGIVFLKERPWKTRIVGALILTSGLLLIGFSK
jgi:drug/metabolite transporter (DMT)-like permease